MILSLLDEFINVAKKQRGKQYLPLSSVLSECLSANVVSDQKLLNAVGAVDLMEHRP